MSNLREFKVRKHINNVFRNQENKLYPLNNWIYQTKCYIRPNLSIYNFLNKLYYTVFFRRLYVNLNVLNISWVIINNDLLDWWQSSVSRITNIFFLAFIRSFFTVPSWNKICHLNVIRTVLPIPCKPYLNQIDCYFVRSTMTRLVFQSHPIANPRLRLMSKKEKLGPNITAVDDTVYLQ